MSKRWAELSPRTKRRYAAQGVTPQRYNAANRRGLRGLKRAEFLGVRPGSISGSVLKGTAFARVKKLIEKQPYQAPIRWDVVEKRVERQSSSLRRYLSKANDFYKAFEEIKMLEGFNPKDNPLWYHDY